MSLSDVASFIKTAVFRDCIGTGISSITWQSFEDALKDTPSDPYFNPIVRCATEGILSSAVSCPIMNMPELIGAFKARKQNEERFRKIKLKCFKDFLSNATMGVLFNACVWIAQKCFGVASLAVGSAAALSCANLFILSFIIEVIAELMECKRDKTSIKWTRIFGNAFKMACTAVGFNLDNITPWFSPSGRRDLLGSFLLSWLGATTATVINSACSWIASWWSSEKKPERHSVSINSEYDEKYQSIPDVNEGRRLSVAYAGVEV